MERTIKYQYFKMDTQVKANGVWLDNGEFDFVEWIQYVSDHNLEKVAIDLKDAKARIEKIKYYKNHDVWVIRFMKLREENLPFIAKENKAAEDIPLQEDEYIGEDMYMLYDINTKIAMIQLNRFSLGLSRLAEFLITSQGEKDKRVRLFPIKKKIDLTTFGKNAYRTLELGFANIIHEKPQKKSTLNDILNTYRKFSGVSGTIKIGIGRTRDNSLDVVEVDKLIAEISECDNVVSAKVRIRDDDSLRTEIVDLLDDCFTDFISYNIKPRQTLEFTTAASSMIGRYNRVKDKIISLLRVSF